MIAIAPMKNVKISKNLLLLKIGNRKNRQSTL